MAVRNIRPQAGPQERFLSTPADIAIYGGAAGGGKTWALLLEPLRHIHRPDFGAMFFRRSTVQIRNQGGLWDESVKLYEQVGAHPRQHVLEWKFPSGATIGFAGIEYDKDVSKWQGSQIALLCFDELTHFTEYQFWYLLSRNRSMSGVRPYVRATCNPDPDSWVASFISWWIDPNTGYAIPERSGVIRYMVRVGSAIMWGDTPEELAHFTMKNEDGIEIPIPPKSVTFIPSMLTDNKALMAANPDYMANLKALSTVEQERLLGGNWKIRTSAGMFKREWFEIVPAAPAKTLWVRAWDLAATPASVNPRAAWTAGVLIGRDSDDRYCIADVRRIQGSATEVERLLVNTATQDRQTYRNVRGSLPQDPGQAGKAQVQHLIRKLAGHSYEFSPETGDKETRALPFAAQAGAGNVYMLAGTWNAPFLDELESFPLSEYKDQVDATSRGFMVLTNKKRSLAEVL